MASKSQANCLNSSLLKGGAIVRHDNSGYAFSCKEFPQVSNGLEMMCRGHWKHIRQLAEVVLPLIGAFFPNGLERSQHLFLPQGLGRDLVGLQHLNW